jgi:hypothetical protein
LLTVLFVFLFPQVIYAATYVGGTISQDTTWTLANSPYVAQSDVTVSSGVTLTIEPGVIVKFNWADMAVYGTLTANGTDLNKIVFTSIKDDSYAGDTNGDGSATTPAKGDWGNLYFGSSSKDSVLNNTTIKWAGRGRFYHEGVAYNSVFVFFDPLPPGSRLLISLLLRTTK